MRSSISVALFLLACTPTVHAQWTQRASLGAGGLQADGPSAYPALSADGRYVAFESAATNLVVGDTNFSPDVFVRDLWTGNVERASVATGGGQGNGASTFAALSADGRYVSFQSLATNLVSGDTNVVQDVFVHDRITGTTERVDLSTAGTQANKISYAGNVSADGRYVSFMSLASNLVTPDYTSTLDCFVRDRVAGTTIRVSNAAAGGPGNLHSYSPLLSADGRYVAFHSAASNIVTGDGNGTVDVFLYDMLAGTNELVSLSSSGVQGDFASSFASPSSDGRFVAFHSIATNLVPGDTNLLQDVYLRDRQLGTTQRLSLGLAAAEPDADCAWVVLSADGSHACFESAATNLVAGDTNAVTDVFVVDCAGGGIERASVSSAGLQADGPSLGTALSADGRWVAFASSATNLVAGDTNGVDDVFLRDRAATGFTSLCDPGAGGVISCPCGNPPLVPGAGCDNSAASGGARLSASGAAYLANDQLLFTTSGEKASATSIVLQGNALLAGGAVFGQGVRCAGGTLRRLYTKTAVGGSIQAPDLAGGDPSVSVRSAVLGDPIAAGERRWYLVYYRDPSVLGGCPATSTFNATQTGEVRWSP